VANPGQQTEEGGQRDWRDCELLAVLPGFTSQPIDLSSRLFHPWKAPISAALGPCNRIGQVEGLTVSRHQRNGRPKDAQKSLREGTPKRRIKEKWEEGAATVHQSG